MPTKILAIDDSKTMRLAIKITFAAEDADVTSVSKGSEAVARAKQMGADVVLVDVRLADGEPSGYDVCKALKDDPATANVPVLLLASNQTGVDPAKLATVGADGFVVKPFDTQELIDKVSQVIASAASRPTTRSPESRTASVPSVAVRPAPVAPPSPTVAPATATATARPAAVKPTTRPAVPAAVPALTPSFAKPASVSPTTPSSPSGPATNGPAPAPRSVAASPLPGPKVTPAAAPVPAPRAAAIEEPRATSDEEIPIAIPIPFTAAEAPTAGILQRLREAGAETSGLDPKVAEALVRISRELIEQVVWEVVPDLAEEILRKQAESVVT